MVEIDIGTWLQMGTGIVALIAGVVGLIALFRKWIKQEIAKPIQENIDELKASISEFEMNSERALTLAQLAHTRLDDHLHERRIQQNG